MANDRTILRVTGADRHGFLQGLITNDIAGAAQGLIYAAFLSPQGKYLADFFIFERDAALFVDVKSDHAAALERRLSMYKLRADVQIDHADLTVQRGLGPQPKGALPDPRHPSLGWRCYEPGTPNLGEAIDWDAVRVAACIPETGIELIHDDTYILEAGFEALHGVDFRKGCYVGQEVTARMKHKTTLRKGLARVALSAPALPSTEILADGKPVGQLHTVSGLEAIAYLRFDRTDQPMTAGGVDVTRLTT
jgi:tRNA-modifying protein YgfZ